MATVHFYEKPGCQSNARQKQLLAAAGHLLIVHDLLQYPWIKQRGKLRSFFGDLPVAEWFNRSAPSIKNGDVIPESVTENQAIDLMVADPSLIRRPLLEVAGRRGVGFDVKQIEEWLRITVSKSKLEDCSRHDHSTACRP